MFGSFFYLPVVQLAVMMAFKNLLQMEETLSYSEEKRQTREKVAVPLLWVSMVSMFMFFCCMDKCLCSSDGKKGLVEI